MNTFYHKIRQWTFAGPVALMVSGGLIAYRPADPAPHEPNRFTKVILAEKLNEPMEMTFLPDGRLLWIERKGALKLMNPSTSAITEVGTLLVSAKYIAKEGKTSEAEDGLIGITVAPNFKTNHWVYLYYSPDRNEPKNILARYELKEVKLVEATKKVVLEVATQREQCCHRQGHDLGPGAKGVPKLEAERVIVLRNPVVQPLPNQFDAIQGVTFAAHQTNRALLSGDGAYYDFSPQTNSQRIFENQRLGAFIVTAK